MSSTRGQGQEHLPAQFIILGVHRTAGQLLCKQSPHSLFFHTDKGWKGRRGWKLFHEVDANMHGRGACRVLTPYPLSHPSE